MINLKFDEYIKGTNNKFVPTGLTKEYYACIIEKCFDAYSIDEIEGMIASDNIQVYSRLTSCLAALLSFGKKQQLQPLFINMMTQACNALEKSKGNCFTDFAVKELLLAYYLLGDKEFISDKDREVWKKSIQQINPYTYYYCCDGEHHNINIYNLTGEWLRKKLGFMDRDVEALERTQHYFDSCWDKQFNKFDSNGMYMDEYNKQPLKNPMLYDLTTRVQMQLITGFGYEGRFRERFDDVMSRGGLSSLFSQSAAFEFPFGGRSNQYLFNEALLVSNFEYEAARYNKSGQAKKAGVFKRAAHLAAGSITRWLEPKKHIKNFYDSNVGTEGYGFYNKYMVTLASFILIGYIFADDTIAEEPCPAEKGGYIFETTGHFNKIFASAAGYSIEIETNADTAYDCSGLGRIHKMGIPTELGLSMPFAKNPNYAMIPDVTAKNLAIEVGWIDSDDKVMYLSDIDNLRYGLNIMRESEQQLEFEITYSLPLVNKIKGVRKRYRINEQGVSIVATLIGAENNSVCFRVPLFVTNGMDKTEMVVEDNHVMVISGEYTYYVESDGQLLVGSDFYGNRNGLYRTADIIKRESTEIEVKLKLGTVRK